VPAGGAGGNTRKDKPTEPAARREMVARVWDIFHASLSRAAKRTGLYIVAGCGRCDGKHMYNSATCLMTRARSSASMTRCNCVWRGESVPARPEFSRIRHAHGKVGMFVCWDILFPEVTQCLMLNGAEILFQPTYGHAGAQADFQAQCRAHDACLPIVISMWGGNGRIIDRDGTILAAGHTRPDWRGVAPDQILYADIDIHAKRKWIEYDDFHAALIAERQPEAYGR